MICRMHRASGLFTSSMLLLLFLLATAVLAEPRFPGGYLNDAQPGRVTTPHIRWARPWAPGTIKVFFLSPGYVAPRELIELWQRFDITYEAVVSITSYKWYDLNREATDQWSRSVIGCNPSEKMQELKEKLARDYDVYVFAQFDWESTPEWVRALVLRKVNDEGKGLVLTWQYRNNGMGKGPGELQLPVQTDSQGQAYLTQGIPFHGLRYFTAKSIDTEADPVDVTANIAHTIKCYTYGKGRIVWIGYHGCPQGYDGQTSLSPTFTTYAFDDDAEYEYYMSLAGRAVTWTAPGKTMPLLLHADPLPDGATYTLTEAATLSPRLIAAGQRQTGLTVRWTVRNGHGAAEQAGTQAWKSTGDPLVWKLAPLGAGKHFLDWIISTPKGTVNWGSTSIQVDGGVKVKTVELDKPSFEPGEKITGKVTLAAACPANCQLRITLVDTFNRQFASLTMPVKAGETVLPFQITPTGRVTLAARVQAVLLGGKQTLAEGETLAYLPDRTWPRYIFSLWGGGWPGTLGHAMRDQLHSAGFNVLGFEDAKMAALSDLPSMPTNISWLPGVKIDDVPFSYVDPVWRQKSIDLIKAKIQQSSPFSFIGYSYGDEMSIGGATSDAPSLKLFAQRLQQRYGTLDKLNAAWNEQYASWDDAATPISGEDALKRKAYGHYEDWVAHEEFLYADIQHDYSNVIHQIQPNALTGAEGSENGDLEETVSGLEFWGPYYGRFQNALLSAIRRERTRPLVWGNWWGSYTYYWGTNYFRTEVTSPYLLWNFTLDGANTVEFFTSDGTEGMRHIDGGFAEHYGWSADSIWQLGNGVGQLIADAAPGARGAYAVHSQKSAHAARLWSPLGGYDGENETLLIALDESGIDLPYLTDRQIEAGVLAKKAGAKVVFLADVQALDDDALSALEQFVANGGTLVADVRPLLCNGSLQPRADGRVEKLFGIQRSSDPAAAGAVADVTVAGELEGRRLALSLAKATVDPTVTVTTGAALGKAGDTPVCIVNRIGRGKTVLLNFTLANYGVLRGMQKGQENGMKEFLLALLGACGVQPVARVERPDGQMLELCRSASFTRSGITVLGLLRRPEALLGSGKATLKLPQPVHLYNVLKGQYLGKQATVPLNLERGQYALFTLTPYKVDQVAVAAPAGATAGAAIKLAAILKVSGGQAGTHVFRLSATGPDGREREALRQVVEAPAGKATFTLPFALNDTPGKWTVQVTDVATGVRGMAAVQLIGQAGSGSVAGAINLSLDKPPLSKEAAAFPQQRDWSQEGASYFIYRGIFPEWPNEDRVNRRSIRYFDLVRLYGLGLQYWGFLDLPPDSEPQYTKNLDSYEELDLRERHRPVLPGKGEFDSFAVTCYCRNLSYPGFWGDFNWAYNEGDTMAGRGFQWRYYVPGLDAKPGRPGFEPDEVIWGQVYRGASLLRNKPDGLAEFRWDYLREDDPAAPRGTLSARFAKGPNDEFAFVRYQAMPDAGSPQMAGPVKLVLKLSAVDQNGPAARERWVRTLTRDVKAGEKLTLDPRQEWALAFYNRGAQESGGNLLAFAPGDVAGATATLQNNLLVLEFTPAKPLGAVRLAFWEFEDTPYETALAKFFPAAGGVRKRLEAVDWSLDRRAYFDAEGYKARLEAMLPAWVPGEAAFRQRLTNVLAELTKLRPALDAVTDRTAPNLQAEWAYVAAVKKAEALEKEVTSAWLQALKTQ